MDLHAIDKAFNRSSFGKEDRLPIVEDPADLVALYSLSAAGAIWRCEENQRGIATASRDLEERFGESGMAHIDVIRFEENTPLPYTTDQYLPDSAIAEAARVHEVFRKIAAAGPAVDIPPFLTGQNHSGVSVRNEPQAPHVDGFATDWDFFVRTTPVLSAVRAIFSLTVHPELHTECYSIVDSPHGHFTTGRKFNETADPGAFKATMRRWLPQEGDVLFLKGHEYSVADETPFIPMLSHSTPANPRGKIRVTATSDCVFKLPSC